MGFQCTKAFFGDKLLIQWLKPQNTNTIGDLKKMHETFCTFSAPVALTDVCVTCCLNKSSIRTQRKRDGLSVPSSWLRMGKRLCSGTWGRASTNTCMMCVTTVSICPSDWALPPSWACGETRIKCNAICSSFYFFHVNNGKTRLSHCMKKTWVGLPCVKLPSCMIADCVWLQKHCHIVAKVF